MPDDPNLETRIVFESRPLNPRFRGEPDFSKPTFGECHVCGTPMPMYLGLREDHPWSFYHCPVCDKLFHYS